MRTSSRQIAFSGVLTALALALMLMGSVIPAATFCCPLLAMVVLLPLAAEFGPRIGWSAYAAVALLSVLLVPDKEIAAVFVFFGEYPLLQPHLDRIRPRAVQILCKLGFCNASALTLYALLIWVFQLDALVEEYAGSSRGMLAVLLAMANVLFVLMDLVIHRMNLLWKNSLRKKFFRRS